MKHDGAQEQLDIILDEVAPKASVKDQTGEYFLAQTKERLRMIWPLAEDRPERLLSARILNAIDRIPVNKMSESELKTLKSAVKLLGQHVIEESKLTKESKKLERVGRGFVEYLTYKFDKTRGRSAMTFRVEPLPVIPEETVDDDQI